MSLRNLDQALEAGQVIEQGKNWPKRFSGINIIKEIGFEKHLDKVYSLQYSLDGELLAVGHGNGGIMMYNSRTGELVSELRKSRHGGLPVMCLKFNPLKPSCLLAGTSDGKLLAFDIDNHTETEIATEKGNEINCIDFSPLGLEFCTAGKDFCVRMYDTEKKKLLKTFEGYSSSKNPTESHSSNKIFALRFFPESDYIFITAGWDNSLKICDSRCESNCVKRTIAGPHICGDSLDIKGYDLLTGSWVAQNSLQIWDYTSGDLKKNIPFRTDGLAGGNLYCARFCDNDVVLAGGSGTNSLQAINSVTDELIGEIKMQKPVQAIATTHGGRMFAAGGNENNLYLASLV